MSRASSALQLSHLLTTSLDRLAPYTSLSHFEREYRIWPGQITVRVVIQSRLRVSVIRVTVAVTERGRLTEDKTSVNVQRRNA